MTQENRQALSDGFRDGIPIGLGYFVVSFTLGIVARQVGMTPFEGFLMSLLNNASAGEYAALSVMKIDAPYMELAVLTLVANARYVLMSAVLSQKFSPDTPFYHRIFVGFDVTDEIFGISVARKGWLNPFYNYGAMLTALPGWSIGTALGIIAGNILPPSAVSALSVALYGMFIAIIIPEAKKSKAISVVSLIAVALSCMFYFVPMLSNISSGITICICAVAATCIGAILFPIKDDNSLETAELEE